MNGATKRVLFAGVAYLGALLLVYVFGVAYQLFFPGVDMYLYVTLNTLLTTGLAAALFTFLFSKGRGMRFTSPGLSALMLIPMSLLGYLAIIYLTGAWMGLLEALGAKTFISGTEQLVPETGVQLLLSLFVVGVVPGICEEWLFRGAFLPAMESTRKRRAWTAILLSGVTFAIMHGSLAALPGHLLLGIVLAYLCRESGSIIVPMIYHALHNGMAMLFSYAATRLIPALEEMAGEAQLGGALLEEGAASIPVYLLLAVVMAALYYGLLFLWKMMRARELKRRPVSERSQRMAPREETDNWTPERVRRVSDSVMAPMPSAIETQGSVLPSSENGVFVRYDGGHAAAYAYIPIWIGWAISVIAYIADALITFGVIAL